MCKICIPYIDTLQSRLECFLAQNDQNEINHSPGYPRRVAARHVYSNVYVKNTHLVLSHCIHNLISSMLFQL